MSRRRKLTDSEVQRVRKWYAQKMAVIRAKDLARELGVSTSCLYQIGKGLEYKTVGAVRERS